MSRTGQNIIYQDFSSIYKRIVYSKSKRLEIIIISIFKEDNVFSITAILPYGPPVNTDIDYYRTFFFGLVYFCSVARLCDNLLGEEKPVLAL